MKENNDKRNEIQIKAVNEWIKHKKKGTCEIITGLGKTFISLHCLNTMPKNDKIHLFLAETTSRKKDLYNDIKKYDKIFKTNILKDYNLQFYCYQSVYKWKSKKFGLVICDEIHDQLSPSYVKFHYNNKYDALLGLTATVTRDTWYEDEFGNKYNKGHLLDKICPVVFKYSIDDSQIDNTSRKLNIHVIKHSLDSVNKNVKAGNSKKVFYQTEQQAYDYWDKQFKKAVFIENEEERNLKIRICSHKRSNILYSLPSKIPIINKLLPHLKGKTIIFGNNLDSLLQITPNVVSSRNSDKQNEAIREAFDNNTIQTIGSFKKLKQGANLKELDNCVIMSYYSTEKDIVQRLNTWSL